MAVNLINSDDNVIKQTNDNIQIDFSADRSELLNRLEQSELNKGIQVLFSGNVITNNANVNLSNSIQNYDFILLVTRSDAGSQSLIRLNTTLIPIELYNNGGTNYNIPAAATSNLVLNIIDDTTLQTQSGFTEYFGLMQVYGIKL